MSNRKRSEKFPHRLPGFIGPQEHPVKRTARINRKAQSTYTSKNKEKINKRQMVYYRRKLTGDPSSPDFRKLNFHTMSDKDFEAMENKERDDRKQELKEYRNKPVWKPKKVG